VPAEVVIYTKTMCPYCDRAKALLDRKGVSYKEIVVTGDSEAMQEMVHRSGGAMTAPQIFIGDRSIGGYDDMAALDRRGGLDPLLFAEDEGAGGGGGEGGGEPEKRDVVILGSGCAGLTAAIYTARANLEPLVVEGREAGGQLTLTTEVENFPGFPEGIQGPDLILNMRKQAEKFGAECTSGDLSKVDLSRPPFHLWIEGGRQVLTRTLIIATGASARMLGLHGEKQMIGHGLSTCATCDGFFFRGKEIAVVGGGDSALEEAIFLTRFASKVTILHRRDELRGSKIMQERAFDNPKIELLWNSVVTGYVEKEGKLAALRVKNVKTEEENELAVEGCFLAIGHIPNTKVFEGQLDLDKNGYVMVHNASRTSVSGVFAAGDVHDTRYRQAITASAAGCKAALDAEKWLEEGELPDEEWMKG
jgi:thioredoxin reductase (NADPH)